MPIFKRRPASPVQPSLPLGRPKQPNDFTPSPNAPAQLRSLNLSGSSWARTLQAKAPPGPTSAANLAPPMPPVPQVYRPTKAVLQAKAIGAALPCKLVPVAPPRFQPHQPHSMALQLKSKPTSTIRNIVTTSSNRLATLRNVGPTTVIMRAEALADAVLVEEGEVKTVDSGVGINYGTVNSCMTITCFLTDGSKVTAHLALYADPATTFASLKNAVAGKKIRDIKAVGGGQYWGHDLKTQQTIVNESNTSGVELTYADLKKVLTESDAFVISSPDKFKRFLSQQLSGGTAHVTFDEHDAKKLGWSADCIIKKG